MIDCMRGAPPRPRRPAGGLGISEGGVGGRRAADRPAAATEAAVGAGQAPKRAAMRDWDGRRTPPRLRLDSARTPPGLRPDSAPNYNYFRLRLDSAPN